jgi:hypothetical protein
VAKYLLLQFDDDEAADKVVEGIQRTGGIAVHYDVELFDEGNWEYQDCDVRGVFKKPTKFCDCLNVKKRGFTRGQKYGWWVCDQCKKPTKGWASLNVLFQALGKNLLPKDDNAPEYRGDGNWIPHQADSGRTSTQPS